MKLELQEISKFYGRQKVLKDISIVFTPGVYGLLGANGAGKTTLMNIICQLTKASHGNIKVNGHPQKLSDSRFIGILPQHFETYKSFSGISFLMYMAILKGMVKHQARVECENLLKLVGLYEVRKKRISSYSGGMKQRLGIAQALLNDPLILILDEPTVGLDPQERLRFRNLISDLSENKIVILSTHILSDIESVARKILVLKDGVIKITGTPSELVSSLNGHVWEVIVTGDELSELSRTQFVVSKRVEDDKHIIRIVNENQPLPNARPVSPKLEDFYMLHIGKGEGLC